MSKTISGFSKLSKSKKIDWIVNTYFSNTEEAKRILKPGGQLIIDYPSRKRRRLFNYKAQNWHAATEFYPNEISEFFDSENSTHHVKGILNLPIHRFPKSIRKIFLPIDNLLCNSPIKQYSSYILHTITK